MRARALSAALLGNLLSSILTGDTLFVACGPGRATVEEVSTATTDLSGTYRARVVTQAKAGKGGDCQSSSTLLIRNTKDGREQACFQAQPTVGLEGNGMRVGGWAPHQRIVALERVRFAYGRDAVTRDVVICHAETLKSEAIDVAPSIVRSLGKQGCQLSLRTVVGFASDTQIAVTAADDRDVAGGQRVECLPDEEEWWIDLVSGRAVRKESKDPVRSPRSSGPKLK